MSGKRLAALSGVGAVALLVAAFAVSGDTPSVDDSPADIVSFYTDNDSEQQWSAALLAWGALLFLVFATTIAGALRRARGETGGSSALAFGGAVVATVGMTIFAGIGFTLGDAVDHLGPASILTLNALSSDMFFTVAIGTAAFLLGAGIAMVKTDILPKWLGWVAIVLGVASFTPLGFFGFLGMGLWILVASVMLSMKADAV